MQIQLVTFTITLTTPVQIPAVLDQIHLVLQHQVGPYQLVRWSISSVQPDPVTGQPLGVIESVITC